MKYFPLKEIFSGASGVARCCKLERLTYAKISTLVYSLQLGPML
jgi:hypothetical protein